MKIGNVTIDNYVVAAPMAGVTDLPFRLLLKEQGAGLVCSEMVSAKAIYYNNKNTEALMAMDERERPFSLQLFGSDPALMADMAKKIEDRPFDILDINMGCPVPKVVNNGEGSALMKQPLLAGKIIEAMAKATTKPVTVKIRKGFDDTCINAPEMAHIAQESGAAAVRKPRDRPPGRESWLSSGKPSRGTSASPTSAITARDQNPCLSGFGGRLPRMACTSSDKNPKGQNHEQKMRPRHRATASTTSAPAIKRQPGMMPESPI